MLKAILFDLDGTLLKLDFNSFLERYFSALAPKFMDLIPPEKFIKSLMASTEEMLRNKDRSLTNQEVFVRDFTARVSRSAEELMPRFEEFYRKEFPGLYGSLANPEAHQVIDLASGNGLDIVLATNPVFPREAVEARLKWAGLSEAGFRLITSYEFMHSCKPHLAYYEEVLDLIGRKPDECLMVGNDVEEDIVAGTLGMSTYLATDFLIDRGSGLKPDYRGPFSDLAAVLKRDFGLSETA